MKGMIREESGQVEMFNFKPSNFFKIHTAPHCDAARISDFG